MPPTRSRRRTVSTIALLICSVSVSALLVSSPVVGLSAPLADHGGNATVDRTGNLTAYRAGNASFGDAAAVEAAIENGTIAPADEVMIGETLVVEIESPRLPGAMRSGNGSATHRFLAELGANATFRLVQTNPSTMRPRIVARPGAENLTVYFAGTTVYALVDTGELRFRYRGSTGNDTAELHGGERFAVQFGYHLSNVSSPGYESWGPVVEFHPFPSQFTGGVSGPLAPEPVRVGVEIGVPPEESLVVSLSLDSGRTLIAPVEPADESGLRSVRFDLGNVTPGTGYVLELRYDGRVVDRHTGTVRTPEATIEDARLTEVDGYSAVNATVELSHGGAIRVYNSVGLVVGSTGLDATGRPIRPGVESNVTIGLRADVTGKLRVRAVRERGPNVTFYPGPDAEATIDVQGGLRIPPVLENNPFTTISIGANGTYTTRISNLGDYELAIEFGDVGPGEPYVLTFYRDGDPVATYTGSALAPGTVEPPRVTVQVYADGEVRVLNERGGFLGNASIEGTEQSAKAHADLRIVLGRNGSGASGGANRNTTAPDPSGTARSTPSTSESGGNRTTSRADTGNSTQSSGQPGFGWIVTALGLVLFVSLSRRKE